jgi:hypothetical protein
MGQRRIPHVEPGVQAETGHLGGHPGNHEANPEPAVGGL